ncbi:MAG: AAA domain-containing protein [Actinomycetia bacterium]|nr:AAA domain-containing protein [Actinomycetes bacterium]
MRPEDACRLFPLRPGVFDVVIFDEASQSNPDQALPLFARAEKVVVFGDQKQLSNENLRRTLSDANNRGLLRQTGLDELDPGGLFDQTRNSLLDLTARRQQATVFLNEHFRCRPEIAAFSNDRYYGNTLTIMRDRADNRELGPALLVREVEDPEASNSSKINHREARAVVNDLRHRLDEPAYENLSFGVLSLFREQIEHIQTLVEHEILRELLDRHQVICSTVDGFQATNAM